ncbi:MAG: 5-bromo-4-chloroindolyl phosphate hydrolysis family protein [Candidatus Margulisbacteria bacterium]|jgi:hypothetical protein|nr:5-bromo-4-chloroindolyl phosphate hydrolysis family protein [Candidatus Margulisiibacteriota bacterium]
MLKRLVLIGCLLLTFGGLAAYAAPSLSRAEIVKYKAQLAKHEQEINRLQKKLKLTRKPELRGQIIDKIDLNRAQALKIKQRLYPRPAKPAAPVSTRGRAISLEASVTLETGVIENVSTAEGAARKEVRISVARHEIGVVGGLLAGTTAMLGEIRVPLRWVFGPATAVVRLSAGLAQGNNAAQRLVPINADLLLNFPPGWFTGVDNYLGGGLNFVAATSDGKPGTLGGQLCYGIVSDGFGGLIFGELGYGVLRTGFSPSYKGGTVMVGFRKALF